MRLKYVMFDEGFPVLFGEYFKHDEVCARGHKPTSAGFVSIALDGTVAVGGKSTALGLSADPFDAKLIQTFLNQRV